MYTEIGPNPLPFSDICDYARILGYNGSESLIFFVRMMQACDSAYLSIDAKRRKAQLAQAKAKRR